MRNARTESKKSANNYALILNAIHQIGVSKTGEAIGRDASFITRLKTNEKKISLEEFIRLLSVWNLELIDGESDVIQVDRVLYKSLVELSHKQINRAGSAEDPRISITRDVYAALLTLSRIGIANLGKTA